MLEKTIKPNIQHNDEIDLKEVFKTLLRYKFSIIFITIIFFISSIVFAYYKQNIYQSSSSVQVLDEKASNIGSTDFMLEALGGGSANIENEIAVLKSRFIIQKALETLNQLLITIKKINLVKHQNFIKTLHL